MNVLSLAAGLAVAGATGYAAAGSSAGTLRLPIVAGKDTWWNDWRLAGGAVALGAGWAMGGQAGMFLGAVGAGALASYGVTEMTRRQIVAKAAAAGGYGLTQGAPAAPRLLAAPVGSPANPIPAGATPANPIPVPARSAGISGYGWAA